jgi:4-aminobutyrate--pyruvate transaminase
MIAAHPAPGEAAFPPSTLPNTGPFRGIIGFSRLNSEAHRHPMVIVRGEGIRLFDTYGREYVDGVANFYSASLGFSDPELIEAAKDQLGRIANFSMLSHRLSEPTEALAERLADLVPLEKAHIGFATSGSEANEAILKFLALRDAYQGRAGQGIAISRWNSYHGSTQATASLGGGSNVRRAFNLEMADRRFLTQPDFDEHARPGESEGAFIERLVDELRSLVEMEGPSRISSFFAEPISVSAGVAVPPEGYFAGVQEVLRAHGIPFVDDEVITGFWKLGTRFGAGRFGLAPDAVTLAKGINSGYCPLGVFALSGALYEEISEAADAGGFLMHGGTYHGHPLACAIALKCLEIYETRDIPGHVARVSQVFARRLDELHAHPLVISVRYSGLLGGIKVDRGIMGMRSEGLAPRLVAAALEEGLILRSSAGCVVVAPPLIIRENEIDELFDRFQRALQRVAAEAGPGFQSFGIEPSTA